MSEVPLYTLFNSGADPPHTHPSTGSAAPTTPRHSGFGFRVPLYAPWWGKHGGHVGITGLLPRLKIQGELRTRQT